MDAHEPKVDDLVCIGCFAAPGESVRTVVGADGKTRIETRRVSPMMLVLDRVPMARCRRCGCEYELASLRRWNEHDLKLILKDARVRPTPIGGARR